MVGIYSNDSLANMLTIVTTYDCDFAQEVTACWIVGIAANNGSEDTYVVSAVARGLALTIKE